MTDFESHPPAGSADRRRGAEWLQPASEPLPLERYVRVLRERIWVVILCVVVCVTATAIYVTTAAKVYEAEADLLVSPAPRDSDSLVGLPIVRESSDPTRDVETVARLVTSSSVARRVRDNIDSDRVDRARCSTPWRPSRSRRATSLPSPHRARRPRRRRYWPTPSGTRSWRTARSSCTTSSTRCSSACARAARRRTTRAAPRRRRSSSRSTSWRRCAAAPTRRSASRTRPSCRPRRSRRGRCSASRRAS